jgi:hypothetical protein
MKSNYQQAQDCLERAAGAYESCNMEAAMYWTARAQVYATLAATEAH